MITIKFYSLIRLLINRNEYILEEKKLSAIEVLEKIQENLTIKFIHKLLDENNQLITGTIILINGKNIHHLQKLDSIIVDGDVVSIFPPGGGG